MALIDAISEALELRTANPAAPEPFDFADQQFLLAGRDRDWWRDTPPRVRDRVFEQYTFCASVHKLLQLRDRHGQNLHNQQQAVAMVAAHAHQFPVLREGGHHNSSALTVHNYRKWMTKIGQTRRGQPDWANWKALLPRTTGGRPTGLAPDFLRTFLKLYLNPNHLSIAGAYRAAVHAWRADGMPDADIPADDMPLRYYLQTRVSNAVRDKTRETPQVYNQKYRGYILREMNVEVGECWQADHRIMDFWIRYPDPENPGRWVARRPYFTAIQDARSQYLIQALIYADRYPNHERILETMYLAALANGGCLPLIWHTDNGKDFLKHGIVTPVTLRTSKGEILHDSNGRPRQYSVLAAIHTRHHAAAPYNAKEKTVERINLDVAADFDRRQLGYCGNSPGTRPDYGLTWTGDVMRLPSEQQIAEAFEAWAVTYNGRTTQSRLTRGQSPATLWQERTPFRPPMQDLDLQLAFLLPHAIVRMPDRTMLGCGVRHRGWTYSHPALREHQGKRYIMIKTSWADPKFLYGKKELPLRVHCFDLEDHYLCTAVADRELPAYACTPEQKALIGSTQHAIAAMCARDTDELERLTGPRRVANIAHELRLLPGGRGDTADTPRTVSRPAVKRPGAITAANPPAAAFPAPPTDADRRRLDRFSALVNQAEDLDPSPFSRPAQQTDDSDTRARLARLQAMIEDQTQDQNNHF